VIRFQARQSPCSDQDRGISSKEDLGRHTMASRSDFHNSKPSTSKENLSRSRQHSTTLRKERKEFTLSLLLGKEGYHAAISVTISLSSRISGDQKRFRRKIRRSRIGAFSTNIRIYPSQLTKSNFLRRPNPSTSILGQRVSRLDTRSNEIRLSGKKVHQGFLLHLLEYLRS
jgi:hypothetical protein